MGVSSVLRPRGDRNDADAMRPSRWPCDGQPGRPLWRWAPSCGVLLLLVLALAMQGPTPLRRQACWALLWDYDEALGVSPDFEGFDNETGVFSSSGEAPLVVPNVVHFLRIGQPEFSFVDFVCVMAAWQRQRPDWVMFHTDLADFRGEFWRRIQATPGLGEAVQIVVTKAVTEVFGQRLDAAYAKWHGGDIARIRILQKYGGIFLDNDAYLFHSLDPLRRFEMSIGWPEGAYLGTQMLVAHPDARFLRVWLESYRAAYVGLLWYYNAGQRPTQLALHARPELVHRETLRLGVEVELKEAVFLERSYEEMSAQRLAVHLFIRLTPELWWSGWRRGLKYPVTFDESNVCRYNVTFLQMARAVLPDLCDGQP